MESTKKKQQTLSSFFSKSSPRPAPSKSTAGNSIRTPDEEEFELPAPKRPRLVSDSSASNESVSLEKPKLVAIDPNQQRASSGTSRYIYSSSPQQENIEQDVPEPGAESKKQRLHEKFVKKLGKPDSIADIKRRNRALLEEGSKETEDADEDEDAHEEPPSAARGRRTGSAKKGASKLTPMEKQVLEIKRKHMDTILVVEVGYKFRFFGEDARVAAKELHIVCIPGKFRYDEHASEAHLDRFASASIPVHRLHVHVKRLVAAGHKVGVVRQLETAALKAAGDNRNAPFVRKLTNLYTKGTYVDEVEGIEEAEVGQLANKTSTSTGFLLCLTETNAKGWGNDEKVQVGIVAVQPATGDIVYDEFEDGFMRSEIETRLLHLAPCELLLVGQMSKATDKLVHHLSGSKTNVFGERVRQERVDKPKTMAAQSYSHVSGFYAEKASASGAGHNTQANSLLEKVLKLSENVTICLSAMITHLQEYGLEHVLDLTNYFQSFSARSHMLLNANTLTSLEIYQNQTDRTIKGSLFWTLDRTQTRFGQRLLRKWVGRPLLDREKLEERVAAVEELLDTERAVMVERLRNLLSKCKTDLEKSLIRIYYGKCTRPELVNVLQSLQQISLDFASITDTNTGFKSSLITSAITSPPSILALVTEHLDKINLQSAKSDDKYTFFTPSSETDDINDHKHGIAGVEHDLDEFRRTAAEKLGRRGPVNYSVVSGIDYLIEIENASPALKRVPASWIKISGTKKVSRFHAPEVVRLLRERDQHKESLAAACDAAFAALLAEIARSYSLLRDTVQSLAVLDCLISLATIAGQPGFVKPAFVSQTQIEVTGARHPMVEQLLLDPYVPNDIDLSTSETRGVLLTGPNMGGKSSYVRSIALISIMAQIGSFVPAESATLGLLDSIFTRMGAEDNMMKGESTFMVELGETSEILRMAGERSLVILDELGRGTSTHDGVAIAEAVLDYVIRERKGLCAFITHYQSLARMADRFEPGVLKNMHMKFTEEKEDENSRITFLYEVGEGTAHRSYGLNVATLANVPNSVVRLAGQKSKAMESTMRIRKTSALSRMVGEFASGKGDGDGEDVWVESLVEGLEGL